MATITAPEAPVEAAAEFPGDLRYEVVGGVVQERESMGTYPVIVASILHEYLAPFVRRAGLGQAVVEALFRLDDETQYRPDVAFVSFAKWPRGKRTPSTDPWEVIPDLAIEVISKTDRAWDVLAKTRRYFSAGVRLVWLVYPDLEVVHAFESFTAIRVLTRADVLDGGELIPGFRLPLADLFEGEAEEPTPGPAA